MIIHIVSHSLLRISAFCLHGRDQMSGTTVQVHFSKVSSTLILCSKYRSELVSREAESSWHIHTSDASDVASGGHAQYLLRTSARSIPWAWNFWIWHLYLNNTLVPRRKLWNLEIATLRPASMKLTCQFLWFLIVEPSRRGSFKNENQGISRGSKRDLKRRCSCAQQQERSHQVGP